LRVLYARQAEVADLQVAVFVDEDVGGFEVAVDDAGGVDVFEAALVGIRCARRVARMERCSPGFGRGNTG